MTLQQWNDRQSYDNSNPELKKREKNWISTLL
jgi:hypothetical protein